MISSAVLLPLLAAVAHAADHRIVVGGPNTLAYTPSNITAAVGDTITFELCVLIYFLSTD
jgi:plastocyanin